MRRKDFYKLMQLPEVSADDPEIKAAIEKEVRRDVVIATVGLAVFGAVAGAVIGTLVNKA
jgi:hypothetical protein